MNQLPLKKRNHTRLIITAAVATVVAAGVAYLYLTEDGETMREDFHFKIKEGFKELASGLISNATSISKETVKKVADLLIK